MNDRERTRFPAVLALAGAVADQASTTSLWPATQAQLGERARYAGRDAVAIG